MKNSILPYILLMALSNLIAGFSQILLKKAAVRSTKRWIDQYLNRYVIIAYGLFFGSTVFSMLGYKGLPLSMTPVFNALSQLIVALLAYLFLKERPGKRRLLGLGVVVLGIVVFSL